MLIHHNKTYKVSANQKFMSEQDIKQKYIAQRNEFNEKKTSLLEQISQHKSAIAGLNKQIDDARPRTEHGDMTCERCDCVSMKYLGRTPQGGCSGGDDIYECEICGKDNLSRY